MLDQPAYDQLTNLGSYLKSRLKDSLVTAGVALHVSGIASLVGMSSLPQFTDDAHKVRVASEVIELIQLAALNKGTNLEG